MLCYFSLFGISLIRALHRLGVLCERRALFFCRDQACRAREQKACISGVVFLDLADFVERIKGPYRFIMRKVEMMRQSK